jgi:hypothetical protein
MVADGKFKIENLRNMYRSIGLEDNLGDFIYHSACDRTRRHFALGNVKCAKRSDNIARGPHRPLAIHPLRLRLLPFCCLDLSCSETG